MIDSRSAILEGVGKTAMGHLGRITRPEDLPTDEVLAKYIWQAMAFDEKQRPPKTTPMAAKELLIPEYFQAVLQTNDLARTTFENFSYSHKKEYVEWIEEAKTQTTRQKRMATMLEWLAEGKRKEWRYTK